MIKKVGITGGIGVGKSFCAKLFNHLGIPVYDADTKAKWLMVNDQNLKAQIIKEFGNESYDQTGELNKVHLSAIIFKNPEKNKRIGQIVHPAVGMDLVKWFDNQIADYGLYEAALMYESGSVAFLDFVIVVDAPLELRIQRTMNRDNITEEQVRDRISKQMPQEEKVEKADFVINNDGHSSIVNQIWHIHNAITQASV